MPETFAQRNKDVDARLGKNLKRLRTISGYSQQALADELGLTFQQIQKYENGKNRLAASTIYQISKIFDIEIIAFYEGVEGSNNEPPISKQQAKLLELYEKLPNEVIKKQILTLMNTFVKG